MTWKAVEMKSMEAYPETLRRGMLARWKRKYVEQGWDKLPADIAKRMKEVPNHLRPTLGVDKLKGRKPSHFLPEDLQVQFDRVLVGRIHGPSEVVPLNDSLSLRDIAKSMTNIVKKFNAKVEATNTKIATANEEALQLFRAGEITAEEARNRHVVPVAKAHGKPSKTWALRFKRRFGWSRCNPR